ncbi:hypothetical protein B0H11DRAFT_540724 [Mycena galericulata]|nr:hypothetical protein B0H11DRAFT_540724 [Mycena galericulata]
MVSPSSSATADNIQTLQHSVIPVLNLARAGVTNISTMKGNKKDFAALKTSVGALTTLKVPGAQGDLETRLTELSLKMTVSDEYSKKILDIQSGVADNIHEFTFHGTISIEMWNGEHKAFLKRSWGTRRKSEETVLTEIALAIAQTRSRENLH